MYKPLKRIKSRPEEGPMMNEDLLILKGVIVRFMKSSHINHHNMWIYGCKN
ncbi:hypothetical protein B4071_0607 [Bacillus subtilis]|nr:hypothetical protein B4071_0607 [Bacillus subtilis]